MMVMSPKVGVQLVRGTTSLWFACQQNGISKNVEARGIRDLKAVKTGFRVSMEEGQRRKQRPYLDGPVDHAKGFGLHPVDIRVLLRHRCYFHLTNEKT